MIIINLPSKYQTRLLHTISHTECCGCYKQVKLGFKVLVKHSISRGGIQFKWKKTWTLEKSYWQTEETEPFSSVPIISIRIFYSSKFTKSIQASFQWIIVTRCINQLILTHKQRHLSHYTYSHRYCISLKIQIFLQHSKRLDKKMDSLKYKYKIYMRRLFRLQLE